VTVSIADATTTNDGRLPRRKEMQKIKIEDGYEFEDAGVQYRIKQGKLECSSVILR